MRPVLAGALFLSALVCAGAPTGAPARELATVTRIDPDHVRLERDDTAPVAVWVSADTRLDRGDRLVVRRVGGRTLEFALPASQRAYVILKGPGGKVRVAAERALPLEQGSNFRDVGGYVTRDGKVVRWGKVFRSGAQPLLSPADLALVDQLKVGTVVDLRSIDERQINPDEIDDRARALFVSNDYGMRELMGPMTARKGEHIYEGMEKLLAPQYRTLYRRMMSADREGAVLYHCSAGQDRTGVATAILYDFLGVDRETILADYHLSTALRRPYWEMPQIDPAQYPGNLIAAHYARSYGDNKDAKAEALYAPSGASHLAQFFPYLDATYGGAAGYMKQVLGFTDADLAQLRTAMLEP